MRVQEMLAYEPHRIDVKKATQHPYFADLRTADDGAGLIRNAQCSGRRTVPQAAAADARDNDLTGQQALMDDALATLPLAAVPESLSRRRHRPVGPLPLE
jgi:hypothetical protein